MAFSSLLFNILILILLPILASSQLNGNVTSGSSITANNTNSTWLSPSGEFAFGFQQVVPAGGYLLAIWFDKMPEKTIIWSANRDNLAPQGSIIQLHADGTLQLNDPRGQQLWASSNLATDVSSYGAMLDSGEFVVVSNSNSSSILWRSSDSPTDTLLPTQTLNQGVSLISSFSGTNYKRGRFKFIMQNDGNLVLYTRNFPMDDSIDSYWSTATVRSGFQLIFNQSGYVYLVARNGTILNNLFSSRDSTSQFYQRLTLDYDGVLRYYVYSRSANSSSSMGWSVNAFFPSNICTRIEQDTGGGACGLNSLCSLGQDQRPNCRCLAGYSPIDSQDSLSGCKRDFVPQSCNIQENDSFRFIEMINTDWPLSDYAHFQPVSEDWCRQACLGDCFCDVARYRNNNCWKKRIPLSNGRIDSRVGGKAMVKIRKNNDMTTIVNPPGSKRGRTSSTMIITGSVLLGSSALLNLLLLSSVLLLVSHLKRRKSQVLIQGSSVHPEVMNIRSFSFKDLHEATNGFSEVLGRGACSTVYKGALKDGNGNGNRIVAVKKLFRIESEADQEFKAEVSSISRTNHKNLVQLLGYCDEGQNRILVYEFMSNGSLANFLFENSSRPNWHRRVQIAFATARGLCYLHEECSIQIIHCDIKPQNVLLDESYAPKISDFGLAKLLRADQTRTLTAIRGTRGYVAPEWFKNMPITVKVDVYSFGILFLELLCCRKNYEPNVVDERKMILSDWAYDCYKEETLDLLVADDEEATDDIKNFKKYAMIAIWCTQEDPALRPHMKRVIHMLEGSVQVPALPDAASFVL